MSNQEDLSVRKLMELNEALLDISLSSCGAQYVEGYLRRCGFSDEDLKAIGVE